MTQAHEDQHQLAEVAGLDRRQFLQRSALTAAGVAVAGSGLSTVWNGLGALGAGAATPSYGSLTFQLSWVKNVEFAGSYIADTKGYYKAHGFSSVNLIAGGASATPMEADVATGKALFGVSSPDITGAAIVKGAPLKIIGAQYQKNPFAVMSMAKTPIKTAKDMYGKKIGVQVANTSVWNAFVKAAGLDVSKIKVVPVQFDPTPLTQGTVDGWFSFITNEPVDLGMKGFKVTTFMLADYGYPLVSEVYIVRADTITSQRPMLKALLKAEIKGWTDNLLDPGLGASLTVNTYGKSLGLAVDEQTLESKAQNLLILNAETKANGILTVTDALIQQNIATLKAGGLDITASQLFDLSLLKEVYQENPTLISALPAVPSPA